MDDHALETDAAVEGAFGFVLATRDQTHGLSFWNNAYGFGPLFNATVFTEQDASGFTVPIAAEEPEWLALPAPLRPITARPHPPHRKEFAHGRSRLMLDHDWRRPAARPPQPAT